MEDKIELTPEQLARVEERKARVRAEKDAEVRRRAENAKRNVIDVDATIARLRKLGKINATFGQGLNPERLRHLTKQACVAHMVLAISMRGTDLECNGVHGLR